MDLEKFKKINQNILKENIFPFSPHFTFFLMVAVGLAELKRLPLRNCGGPKNVSVLYKSAYYQIQKKSSGEGDPFIS